MDTRDNRVLFLLWLDDELLAIPSTEFFNLPYWQMHKPCTKSIIAVNSPVVLATKDSGLTNRFTHYRLALSVSSGCQVWLKDHVLLGDCLAEAVRVKCRREVLHDQHDSLALSWSTICEKIMPSQSVVTDQRIKGTQPGSNRSRPPKTALSANISKSLVPVLNPVRVKTQTQVQPPAIPADYYDGIDFGRLKWAGLELTVCLEGKRNSNKPSPIHNFGVMAQAVGDTSGAKYWVCRICHDKNEPKRYAMKITHGTGPAMRHLKDVHNIIRGDCLKKET